MLVQAALSALFILAATQGSTVHSAYLMLVDATLIVYFIPYLYMFAAAIRLRRDIAALPDAIPVPGGGAGSWLVNGAGFATTLLAIVLALIPPSDTPDRGAFFLKVFGGSVAFLIAGFIFFSWARRRRERAD